MAEEKEKKITRKKKETPRALKTEAKSKARGKRETKPKEAEEKKEHVAKKLEAKTKEVKPAKEVKAKKVAKSTRVVIERPRRSSRRKVRVGRVVSNKMDKTLVVSVETLFRHPLYKKTVKRSKKLVAHDPQNQAMPGDLVEIMETRPLSRLKRWRLVSIVEKAK